MSDNASVFRLPIEYPESLPVSARREDIAEALRSHQVIVVAGETGSGKTTQIPKICVDLGYGNKGLIGHTQPRRLAARSVAARIAEELHEPLGRGVGYQVRFTDRTGPATRIKLMTDGILLNEIQRDRMLRKYEVLIIDEAHERSLNIDFLLGYLRQLAPRRPDLKIIITSATIDVEKFSEHFNSAPVISVSGRSFPVEVIYQDPENLPEPSAGDDPLVHSVVTALRQTEKLDRQRGATGDVLVFLSGEREIRDVALQLKKTPMTNTEVMPLYARLGQSEQKRIFQPHTGRRIVLSTNVAETSLTVPGIIYVIDSGLARISRYSIQSKVQRLPVERISRASANQRAGRCGRVASGVCIRLYSEEDYLSRPEFTDPEIQRTNLSAVILQMLVLRLGDIEAFPFVEPPDRRAINDGFRLLSELGAIDNSRQITALGRQMARLPTDPRLARMLLEGARRNCLYEMLIIVSALSIQDPRESPADKREAARESHAQFQHTASDFLSFVLLWREYENQRQSLSQGQLRKYCRDNFLSFMRMREWRETHRQLMLSCQELGINTRGMSDAEGVEVDRPDNYEAVHRAILSGSLNQTGQLTDDRQYAGSRNRRFSIFPTSSLARSRPGWIVTAELIETRKLYATMAARIEPQWIVDAAGDLVRREYFEPHWSKKRGQVMAWERISLFGMVLIEKQRVSYGAIDPRASHELFLREALVGDALNTRRSFLAHNRKLIEEIRREEDKRRRPDILVSDDEIYAFYAERIPESVCNARDFERWCERQDVDRSRLLHMGREDLLRAGIEYDQDLQRAFPDQANISHNRLQINYRFAPGSEDDGVSIDVPLALLGSMTDIDLDWAIPGQVNDRAVALIKALPKSLRKQFIPIPDFVAAALKGIEPGQRPLKAVLVEQAKRLKGVNIDVSHWQQVELPPHLVPRIRLLDGKGELLDHGDDLAVLQQRHVSATQTRDGDSPAPLHPIEVDGLRDWSVSELPEQLKIEQGITLVRFPALEDQGDSVAVRLFDNAARARKQHRVGVARLLMFRTPQQRQLLDKRVRRMRQSLGLKFPPHLVDFPTHALLGIYIQHFRPGDHEIRNREIFDRLLDAGRTDLLDEGERLVRLYEQIMSAHFHARQRLAQTGNRIPKAVLDDISRQLEVLMPEDFPLDVPDGWLREYPRYFKALELRMEKLPAQAEADGQATAELHALETQYAELASGAELLVGLEDFAFLLQELRVSLFAQSLGTRQRVSPKRLQKKLDEAARQALLKGSG